MTNANVGSEFKQLIQHPGRIRLPLVYLHNVVLRLLSNNKPAAPNSKEIDEIIRHAVEKSTDISDHLVILFTESLSAQPKLIVELGVRGGESTFVFERVAALTHAKIISVDIEDCSSISSFKDWTFVQQDDIKFAESFPNWCENRGISPQIDVLFIDTSHLYAHTLEEIKSWFPLLAKRSKVIFHDTHMRKFYRHKDRSIGVAWVNDRGVIAALEDYFHHQFQESQDFSDVINGWIIRHYAYSSGLTILEKIDAPSRS